MAKKNDNIILVPGCPLWMLTLGDCISLLVTFFVMLLSFSTPDADQLADALSGMKGALGMINSGSAPSRITVSPKTPTSEGEKDGKAQDSGGKGTSQVTEEELAVVNLQQSQIINRYNDFKQRLLEIGFSRHVSSEQLENGIVIRIPFSLLYQEGNTGINLDSRKILESFANLAGSVGNEIRITACFNLTGGANEGREWAAQRDYILFIGRILNSKYNIHDSRMTYGYEVIPPSQPPFLELLLAEKMGISRISINELLNLSQSL